MERNYTNFPRNTKAAYIKSCAQALKDAQKRAEQEELAYMEHTPTQNTDALLKAVA